MGSSQPPNAGAVPVHMAFPKTSLDPFRGNACLELNNRVRISIPAYQCADWSSSESSEDEETSMQTSRDNGKENVSPMIAAKQSIKRPEAASRHVLQPNAPLSCDSDTTGRSSEHDSFLDCETLDGPDTDALVLGESIEYRLPGQLARKLYAHQVQGVRWLWSLFSLKRGGILGDDMGLGKTLQCATFIAGLLHSKLIRYSLLPKQCSQQPQHAERPWFLDACQI